MLNLRQSLKGRLAIYFAAAITFSLLISGFLSVGLVQRYLRQKTVDDLKFQVETLSQQIESEGVPQRRYIADLEKMYQTRALVVSYREQELGGLRPHGRSDEAELSSPLRFINWETLKKGETQVSQTQLPELDQETIVVAHGLSVGGQLVGAVVLAKPLELLQSWRPLAGEFLIAAAASLAVSLLLSFLLARRLSRPLVEITEAASAVAAGDFSKEIQVRSQDEIGQLAEAFREMSAEVQSSQEQQRQFVINVSHELRTPLTAISGHTQALRDGVVSEPGLVAKSLGVIDSETGRLRRLIEDLLNVAKLDARQFALKRTTVDLAKLLTAAAASFAQEVGAKGVELKQNLEPGLKLDTDPDRLSQILSNLVHNALAHTPAGGSVTLSSRAAEGAVIIEVADTGPGVAAADLPHLFDRFYRGQQGARGAGLGLGLPISRELARALGGDLVLKPSKAGGACFIVTLPAAAQQSG